jgi:hypothetical protein
MSKCKQLHESLIRTLALIEASGLSKSSSSWKNVAKAIKKILNEKPVDITKAYEKMPVNINLNDPSLPVIKKCRF